LCKYAHSAVIIEMLSVSEGELLHRGSLRSSPLLPTHKAVFQKQWEDFQKRHPTVTRNAWSAADDKAVDGMKLATIDVLDTKGTPSILRALI